MMFTFVPSEPTTFEPFVVMGSTKTAAARQAAHDYGFKVPSHKVWITSSDEVVVETAYGSAVIGFLTY